MELISFQTRCSMSISKACDFLNEKMPDDNDIDGTLADFHLTGEQVFKDIQKALSNRKTTGLGQFLMNVDDDEPPNEKENQSTSKGRGSRATKSTNSKTTTSKAAANKTTTASTRGKGSTRGRAAAASLNVSVRVFTIFAKVSSSKFCLISDLARSTAYHSTVIKPQKYTSHPRHRLRCG